MAIIDLPTTPGFIGASFTLDLDVSESGYQGFYTGNRQRQSTLSDRLTGILVLPPTTDVALQGLRESLLFGLRSSGDQLRMAMPHRPALAGTLSGSPIVASNAAAGARSMAISGARAAPNMLRNGTSLGSNWTLTNVTISSNAVAAPDGTTTAEEVVDSGAGDTFHYLDQGITVTDNTIVTASARIKANINGWCRLVVLSKGGVAVGTYFNASTGALGAAAGSPISRSVTSLGSGWYLVAVTMDIGTGGTSPVVRFNPAVADNDIQFTATGSLGVYLWGVQCELGSTVSDYAGLATARGGDWIGVGGNALLVAYAGATADDAGAMTIPLALPLPEAVTASAAVSLAPTCLWEWDGAAPQFVYSPGRSQGAITIPLRQVIA